MFRKDSTGSTWQRTAKAKHGQFSHCCSRTVPFASQRREPTHGHSASRPAIENRDGAEFGYFFLSKKQLKVGSHSLVQESWRMGGTEQSDWCYSRPTDTRPSYRCTVCGGEEIGYSLQSRTRCFKKERKKKTSSPPLCKERNSAWSRVSPRPWGARPTEGSPSLPPALQSPVIKQRVSTGLHLEKENTSLNPNTGSDKYQIGQKST